MSGIPRNAAATEQFSFSDRTTIPDPYRQWQSEIEFSSGTAVW